MNSLHQTGNSHEAIKLVQSQASTDIIKHIKDALGGSLLEFLEPLRSSSRQKQSQETIKKDFGRLNNIIDEIQNHLQMRFQSYQKDILAIVKHQIDQMNMQTKRLAQDLQERIQQKKGNNQLWFLKNQIDFFRCETFRLFQTNKKLQLEIKLLKQTIQQYQIQFEASDLTLQKIKKKQLKNKLFIKQTIQATELSSKFLERNRFKVSKLKIKQKLETESIKRINTEGNEDAVPRLYPKSSIKFQNHTLHADNISIPSLSNNTRLNDSLQKSRMKKTNSNEDLESLNYKTYKANHKKCDKGTQTNYYPHLNASTEDLNIDLEENSKNLNLLKNGFVLNTPSRIRKQSIFKKSIDCPVEKDSIDIDGMNKTFARNKLLSSSLCKPKLQRSLFQSTKQ